MGRRSCDAMAESHDPVPVGTAARIHGSARSGDPMASSMSRARLGAPPCSGPDMAPMAPTIAAARSAPVEAMTRAAKVEALNPWSTVRIMYCSMALTRAGDASTPVSIHR